MKRFVILGLLLAAIATLSLADPQSVKAAPSVYCRCGVAQNTVTLSRQAATCAQATAALRSALQATYVCYECRDAVLHSSCTSTGGEDPFAMATGYLTFRCYVTGGCAIP